jgi:phosphoserine phosphatase RsbU/P
VRVLIAEDAVVPRRILQAALTDWGHEVVVTVNGLEAWAALQRPDAPKLVVLDWVMPGLDGPDVCAKLRAAPTHEPAYVILLTGRDAKEDIVAGLRAGANDYVTKPFDPEELRARIRVGEQMVGLQTELAGRVRELEQALAQVKRLHRLLPMCCYCKKIRDDRDYWQQVDQYFLEYSEVRFSHGICPGCLDRELKALEDPDRNEPEPHIPEQGGQRP